METGLQLLMRDGAVRLTFKPRLTAEHYAELIGIVNRSETKAQLFEASREAADKWGVLVYFDDMSVG